MDPMCMNAVLFLSSPLPVPSLVSMSSSLAGHVGLSTVSEVTSSYWVVPLTYGGVCSLVGEPIPPKLEREGGCLSDCSGFGFASHSESRAYSLRWFSSSEARYTYLQPWVSDFNPSLQKSTNAQIGVPLALDTATSDGDFGHYARVLVEVDVSSVDVSSVLPTSMLLERDEFHSSFTAVEYENFLAFCSICSSIGHLPSSYRWNKSSKGWCMIRGLLFRAFRRSIKFALWSLPFYLGHLRVKIQSSGPLSESQAELHLIADSSWFSHMEKVELDVADVARISLRVERQLAFLKSGYRAPPTISDD
ncbi:hypothetical protein Dsin_012850 [Dipteronia sinensis]|uniref:Uncharacterized protein n=1 Tax=Dipteronia sinensis TaxID=43782 RepID=A0AAE0AJP0_9ROSI|nr:hypothetical protein Dsin_012850 [Dipteronia sinensis]